MAAIATDRLTKRFSSSTTAVDHVNITVEEGEVYGLLGRNGAGKSTLMGMLLGLLEPTSGSFQIFGRSGSRARVASDIGALIESPAFYPFLSARRNLEVVARYCGASAKDVGIALERVGLDDVAGRRFSRFSLGMKQRLGVAAAILGDPALVILDEPTNGLDPQAITQMRELIRSLRSEGRTVLLSSHILAEVEQVVDRVAIIANGAVVTEGSLQNLRAQHSADGVTVIVRTGDDTALAPAVRELPGVRDVQSLPDGGVRIQTDDETAHGLAMELTRRGIGFTELTVEAATLETVFLELTAQQTGDTDDHND